MTYASIRDYWIAYRKRSDEDNVASKGSQFVVLDLYKLYRTLSADERHEIDKLLEEQLGSDDATVRFDSVAVIQEFRITSAVPGLHDLVARLKDIDGPQARHEMEKAQSLISDLETSDHSSP
jgi:hypothetical protein